MIRVIYIVITLSLLGCNQSDKTKSVLVNLNASGEIQLLPDMASITVNVSCVNKNILASGECTKKSVAKLFALLDEHKVDKKDYHSSRVNLEKEYIWKNNSQVFRGYKSSSTINVVFKDLKVMGSLLAKVMLMKRAEVYGLTYSHSQLESYSNKAYLKALDNAATLADEIKIKLAAKSIEILKISNIRAGFDSPEPKSLNKYSANLYESDASSAIQVNPGSLSLIKEVYVQYQVRY